MDDPSDGEGNRPRHFWGALLGKADEVGGLYADKHHVFISRKSSAGSTPKSKRSRQIDVVGRRTPVGREIPCHRKMDRTWRGSRAHCIDDDRSLVSNHTFHQPQTTPIVLRNVDIVAVRKPVFEGSGHSQANAVVRHEWIAEADHQCSGALTTTTPRQCTSGFVASRYPWWFRVGLHDKPVLVLLKHRVLPGLSTNHAQFESTPIIQPQGLDFAGLVKRF